MGKKFSGLKKLWFLCLLALFKLLSGCATPILTQQSSIGSREVVAPDWNTVFLLTPKITYKDVQTEQELSPDQYDAKTTSKNIVEFASNAISQKGFRVLQENDLTPDQVIKLSKVLLTLSNQSEDLLKQRKDKEVFLAHLQEVHNTVGAEILMVQILKVKVGKSGYLIPGINTSGVVVPGTSTSHILASLIDVKTEEVIWRNEVFFRKLPKTGILNKSLEMLFSTFPAKRKEETR